jgi:uncharacterized protein (TIGR03437 family)
MKIYLAKLTIIGSFIALAIFCGVGGRKARAYQSGPDPSRTGAPGELNCSSTAGCHTSFALNSGPGTLTLTGLPANYSAGQEINLTVTLNQSNRALYGFEITAIDDQGRQAGTFTITDPSRTQLFSGVVGNNLRRYISHNFNGSFPNGTNQGSWNFRWTAPATSTGRVTFYVAGNAANGSGTEIGDFIYTKSFSTQPGATVPTVTTVSAASFQAGAASEAIEALFGTGLAGSTEVATALPLPTTLGGVQVKVKDGNGIERDAGLFFVSAGQINLLVPQGTGGGPANVTVLRNGTAVGTGTLTVDSVAPGLFTFSGTGQGLAAANIFRLKADGSQSTEAIAQFNANTGRFDPIPIDLGSATDQVFLIAFGTGFRNRSSLNNVSATIGGEAAEVLFAGATPGLAGLDQGNIRIPRSLVGRGSVDVIFRADGKTANTVQVTIK